MGLWAAVNAPGEDTSLDQDIYPYSALDLAQVVCTTFGVERKITFSNRNESAPCLHLSWQKAKRFFDVGVPMTLEVGTGRMAQWAKSVDARATPEFDEVEVWSEFPGSWLNAFDRSDETQARSVRQFTSCARSRPSSVRERTRGWPPVYSGRSGGDGAVASLISKVARSYAERGFVSTNQEIVRRLRRQRDGGSTSASAPEATQDDDRQALENVVPVAEPVSPSVALRMHLGLTSNLAYAEERNQVRADVIERLAGCGPKGGSPEEMEGYLQEAALRFRETMEWTESALARAPTGVVPSMLEVGSNPYFLTLLILERFRQLEHLGVNYFGDASEVGTFHNQGIVDQAGAVTRTSFLYADIERTWLDQVEPVDVCLFCEVIEHLPFDPGWAMFNLASRLKAGGTMILTTPNPARWDNVERLALHTGTKDDPISGYGLHGRHNREYTADELSDLMTGTGFSVLRQRTLDVFPNEWSESAEARGYGAYHVIEGVLESGPGLYRPSWLYRSFEPGILEATAPLPTDGLGRH